MLPLLPIYITNKLFILVLIPAVDSNNLVQLHSYSGSLNMESFYYFQLGVLTASIRVYLLTFFLKNGLISVH